MPSPGQPPAGFPARGAALRPPPRFHDKRLDRYPEAVSNRRRQLFPAPMPVDHYENFPVASLLLPPHLRKPVEILYRFARSADDLADEGDLSPGARLAALAAYGAELDLIEGGKTPLTPLFQDLAPIIAVHALPLSLFRDLLSAFAQDVTVKRYATYTDLLDYCRRSANPVGRLLLHLFGRATPANQEDSDKICTALQLINFWQDVAVDWEKDRIYLPQEDLERYAVTPEYLAETRVDGAWTRLMDFEVDRARALMQAGAPLCRRLPGRLGWEIRFTVHGGLRILSKIRRVRGDVFHQRPILALPDWLSIALAALLGWRPYRP